MLIHGGNGGAREREHSFIDGGYLRSAVKRRGIFTLSFTSTESR